MSMSPASIPPYPLPHTIRDLLEEKAATIPDRSVCVTQHGEWTYGELNHLADRLANGLFCHGITQHDRVLAVMPNCFDMVCLYFAVAKLGAIIVFVNPDFESELFNGLIRSVAPKAVVLDSVNRAKLSPETEVPVIVGWPDISVESSGHVSFQTMLKKPPVDRPRPNIRPADASQFVFTSGTTGLPKACILSHRARLALVAYINGCLKASPTDRYYACLPNSHGNVFLGLLGAVLAGGTCILGERFSASSFWEQVRDSGATLLVLHGVPMNILLANAAAADERRHAVQAVFTIGGRYPEFLSHFGIEHAVIGYGSTDAGGLVSLARVSRKEADQLPSTFAGWIRDDIEVRIADQDDEELPVGEHGEILVRPRRPSVICDGYSGLADTTLASRRNLWLHTGDLGFIAPGGVLHFAGRAREAIRVGGEFVPVEYLENLVRRHELVEDCAVVGVPAEMGEEELALFVQVKRGSALSDQAVLSYLRPLVPKFMLPRRVDFVEAFPRTPITLKIQKAKLTEPIS